VNDSFHPIPASIHLYQEGNLEGLNIGDLGRYLKEKTRIPFHLHGNVYKGIPEEKAGVLAKEFARIKVKDPGKKFILGSPLQAEVDYEKRRIKDPKWKIFGILYEGIWYQKIACELIDKGELDINRCSILFTNQLFGTWDRDDRRYHARVSLYGFPHLISTTGLVEAPAKPKEFYLKKQMGLPLDLLKEEYQGRFLDHGDARITEVLKGYAIQALFFHLSGKPFCEDPDCRLFNSHWQEEVLHAQIDGHYEFCPKHEAILRALRDQIPLSLPLERLYRNE
jgi:hypothetical protein